MTWIAASTAIAASLFVAGCGGSSAPRATNARSTAVALPGAGAACARRSKVAVMTPIDEVRQSGSVALAKIGERTVAFVADEDARAVIAIDVDAKAELATTPLEGAPSHLMITRDGRLLVALRDEARVVVLEPSSADAPLTARCAVATAAEPLALAATPDDSTVLVASGWGAALASFDEATMVKRFEVQLAREPRAVLVSDDGETAIIAHAVGSLLSRVDLDDRHAARDISLTQTEGPNEEQRRTSCQNYALAKSVEPKGRIFAPGVSVDAGDTTARADGYGSFNAPTEVASVAVVDDTTFAPLPFSLAVEENDAWSTPIGADAPDRFQPCLLPRAAAVDGRLSTLLVACFGSDSLVAFDASATGPARAEKRRWKIGSGPTGVAIDPSARRAVVFAQFDRSLHVVALDDVDAPSDRNEDANRGVARIALRSSRAITMTSGFALGRELFHATFDPRISKDGRACASCHPDGRDDALTWATPDGPRRTLLLAGRLADTAPYGWNGAGTDLETHLGHTFERLSGSGLGGVELRALEEYVSTLRPPSAPVDRDADASRGDVLFHSRELGCATCHTGTSFTDGQAHDVKSKTRVDRSAAFDTPTLRFVSKRAPYFHDGRFRSLRDLLRQSDATMGHTSHLSIDEAASLEAYLRSL